MVYTANAEPLVVTEVKVVDHYIKDVPPIMKAIATCESQGKQYKKDGSVVTGKVNPGDKGKWQINEGVWGAQAKKLGYDIHTEKGNEAMAMWIFEHKGSVPWRASSDCWNK